MPNQVIAQTTPEIITLQNPSFETADANVSHLTGWTTVVNTDGTAVWAEKTQKAMPEGSDGAYYVRCLEGTKSVQAGTVIKQTVSGCKPGYYVLKANCCASRNGQRGDINALNMYAYLYIADDDKVDTVRVGETGAAMPQKSVTINTVNGGTLEIGYGVPSEIAGIPKGWLQVDNFILEYYGTTDPTTGVKSITTAKSENSDDIYSVNGQLVRKNAKSLDGLEKGVYIKNNKKVLVK